MANCAPEKGEGDDLVFLGEEWSSNCGVNPSTVY